MSKPETPTLRVVRLQAFKYDVEDRDVFFNNIVRIIKEKYGNVVEKGNVLEVSTDKNLCQFILEELEGFLMLSPTINYDHGHDLESVLDDDLKFFDMSSSIQSSLSSTPLSTFTIFIPLAGKEQLLTDLIEQYSKQLSKPKTGVGIVRGFLLSIFESKTGREELFNKYYFLSPLNVPSNAVEKRLDEILGEIKYLVVYTAELSELYDGCKRFFVTLEPGE